MRRWFFMGVLTPASMLVTRKTVKSMWNVMGGMAPAISVR